LQHRRKAVNCFLYLKSNFIHQGLCLKTDIGRAFGASEDSVNRAYKKFVEEGVRESAIRYQIN